MKTVFYRVNLGIFSFTRLVVKTKLVPMPKGINWSNLAGISLLGGSGFTVSLFIANLSFGETNINLLNQVKLGAFSGSILAELLGIFVLFRILSHKNSV